MSEFEDFVRLSFDGGRVHEMPDGPPALPVDLLPEVVAYRDLLVAVAREVYLSRRPHRQRIPRNFADDLGLVLRRLDAGSVAPVLERFVPDGGQLPLGEDELTSSQRMIEEAFRSPAGTHNLPPELRTSAATVALKNFGRNLRSDEWVSIARPGVEATDVVRYDEGARRALLASLTGTHSEVAEEVTRITALDSKGHKATLQPEADDPFTVEYAETDWTLLHENLRPDGLGPRVAAEVEFQIGHDGGRKGIGELLGIRVVEVELGAFDAAREAIVATSVLDSGWIDGETGTPIPAQLRVGALEILRTISHERLPPPSDAYATGEQSIRLFWSGSGWMTSMDLFDDGSVEIVATHEDRNPSTILEYPTVAELVADIGVLEDLTSE
jgi:hypothetical protein